MIEDGERRLSCVARIWCPSIIVLDVVTPIAGPGKLMAPDYALVFSKRCNCYSDRNEQSESYDN